MALRPERLAYRWRRRRRGVNGRGQLLYTTVPWMPTATVVVVEDAIPNSQAHELPRPRSVVHVRPSKLELIAPPSPTATNCVPLNATEEAS